MPNVFDDFDLSSGTATAVETPTENVFSDFELPGRDTPQQEDERIKETLDISEQYKIPPIEAQQFVAGPEPSTFGKLLTKVKDLANEWILRPEQVGPEVERITRAGKEFGRGTLAVGAEAVSKLSLGALDVVANKTVGDKSLADLVLRVTDQRAMSPEEKAKAETLGYLPAFVLPGMAVRKGLSYVPARQFLKTILGAGLTFGSTDLALQESRKLITGEPIDWQGVHLQSGVGVLFGFGEVAVAATLTGLAKGIEKYWGEKGIEVAAKIRPEGRSLEEQVAKQEAEIRADVERAKQTFRETGKMPDDLMEKYVYGKPKEGSSLAPPEPVKAEKPAQAVEKAPVATPEARTPETGAVEAATGQTIKVYHGTNQAITAEQLKSQPSRYQFGGAIGEGIYFGQERATAEFYGKNVIETEITPKNPLIIGPESPNYRIAPEIQEQYQQTSGYDSILAGERIIPFDVKIGDTWHKVRDEDSLYQIGALAKAAGYDAVFVQDLREGATVNEEALVLDESIIKRTPPAPAQPQGEAQKQPWEMVEGAKETIKSGRHEITTSKQEQAIESGIADAIAEIHDISDDLVSRYPQYKDILGVEQTTEATHTNLVIRNESEYKGRGSSNRGQKGIKVFFQEDWQGTENEIGYDPLFTVEHEYSHVRGSNVEFMDDMLAPFIYRARHGLPLTKGMQAKLYNWRNLAGWEGKIPKDYKKDINRAKALVQILANEAPSVLEEYKSEPWAQEALKKGEAPVAPPKGEAGFLGIPFETPTPEALREGAERIYQNYINRFASIENIEKKAKALGMEIKSGESPTLRAREYLGLGRKVEEMLQNQTFRITPEGNVEITGEGLKPILDDFDNNAKSFEPNRNQREQDRENYLISQRTILDLQRPAYEGAKRLIVTPEQTAEAQEQITVLMEKYGPEGMKVLEDSAQRTYEYEKRVLHLLVDAGNLSQKQFDRIVDANPHYIPFDRVLEEEQIMGGVPKSKKPFTEARAPIQRIKGSELEIHNTTESIIKNTYKIAEAAERNTVAKSVAKLGEVLPDDITPVRIKMFPIRVDPKEILTIAKEFRSQSAKVMEEVKTIRESGGEKADISGPIQKLEKIVKDALTHRGFSEAEAGSFISQIRKGKPAEGTEPHLTVETIRQVIKETQQIIISEEPVETTIFRPSQFKPKGRVIEYFENGKRKYIEVPKNLYDAMTGMNESGAGLIVKIFSKPAHWLRIGATITPEFMVRNPIRDQYTALMQTSFGFTPFVDTLGAIADILRKTSVYHDWMRSGGAYSGFVELNRPALEKAAKELQETTTRKLLKRLNIITDAQDLSQLFEQATRVAVFKRARKAGMTDVEAAFESREATLDFPVRGAKMADVNRVFAFFNAGIRGVDKTIRTTITHPYSTALKGAMTITLPSLILYLINRNDDEYKEIPRWQKDLFWIIPIGGIHFRFPKPFLYGQVFGSLPERLFEYIDTKDPTAFDKFWQSVYDSVSPVSGSPESGLLFTAIKPIIENATNYNFFLERPIVPESVEDLAPPEQYSRYTSETAKQVGKWINYSPAKIENLIQGYFGGTGRYALEGTDALVNGIRNDVNAPERPKEWADIPLIKGFVTRPAIGPSAESVQKFYEDSDTIIANYNSFQRVQQQGNNDRAEELLKEQPELELGPTLLQWRRTLSELSKQSDLIVKSGMKEEDKRKAIQNVDKQRVQIAREANMMIRMYKKK